MKKASDYLLVMTRLPQAGRNKTRLIPALGPEGAAAFHDRLARHSVAQASNYALLHSGTTVRIHLDGGSPLDGRSWLGDLDFAPQGDGDLGDRLQAAVERAFSDGARRVVVIGTDCPAVDASILAAAFKSLGDAEVVFGPAEDGGYYLVGMRRPCPEIFQNIAWGGPDVLSESLGNATRAGYATSLLGMRADVDVPVDIPAAMSLLGAAATVSVIIPTLNEERGIRALVDYLQLAQPHEIIVSDGGSTDRTVDFARRAGAQVVEGARGRAAQMNAAATVATGEMLLFLHADTVPPAEYPRVIHRVLQQPGTSAGAFRFELAGDLPGASVIEALVRLRCRLFATPYGDQGQFVRRDVFRHVGGFPDWPVMEDLHLIRRLKQLGRVRITVEPASTSPRRWEKCGILRTFLLHQILLTAYYLGVPAKRIVMLRGRLER